MDLNMNSDEILDLIDSIAGTSGKNDKTAMLKACSGSDDLRRALKATYDPTISYGVKTMLEPGCVGDGHFNAGTWELIDNLRTRALTGNDMLTEVRLEMESLTPKSAELLRRILLKDMRAGFSDSTTNKVWPKLIPEFPYQRCCLPKDAKMDKWDWSNGHISQEKADGMFANVNHEEGGAVFIYSRQGTMFPMDKFASLKAQIARSLKPGTQTHGEILVERDGVVLAREIGNGIMNSVLQGGDFGPGEQPVLYAWDQIPLASVVSKGKCDVPYFKRLRELITQANTVSRDAVRIVPTRRVRSLAEAYAHYVELLDQGKEGTVLKNLNATWRDGTSKEQVKLKLEFVVELEIVGFEAGKGKNADTFGSMITRTRCGELEVCVSGITDALRAEIHNDRAGWTGGIISVKANGIMKPSDSSDLHSLFLPRFVERRLDKSEADSLNEVFAQEQAAKAGEAIAAANMKVAA